MPTTPSKGKRIAEDSVRKATGFGWEHWFKVLDDQDAITKSHKEIAEHLVTTHNLSGWWSQMVTVEYERERGMRDFRQRSDGYAVDVSRVIGTTVEKAWQAWADPAVLSQWFTTGAVQEFVEGGRFRNDDGDSGTFKRIRPHKLIRFTWESKHHQPGSEVTITFNPLGENRLMLGLGHMKLKSREDCEDLKEGWSWAMDCLKLFLETGKKVGFEEWKAGRK